VIIRLWRGYHHPELLSLLDKTWKEEDLLITCPPLLEDFSFVNHLPEGPVEFVGDWSGVRPLLDLKRNGSFQNFSEMPVLGVFTSGTMSGEPRLVLYSKKNIESSLQAIQSLFDEKRIRSIFCYPQPFHTFGLLLGYVWAYQKGLAFHCWQGKYGRGAHDSRLGIQDPGLLTLATPTHFRDLLIYLQETDKKISPSYSCILGGAPVTVDLWEQTCERFRIEQPSIGYGCSEASPGITHLPPGQKPREDGEIGFPLSSLQSFVSAEGVEISGNSLCMAMIDNNQLVQPTKTLIRDQLKIRQDGVWLYQGRVDLLLNRGGMKYSIESIERSLLQEIGLHVACSAIADRRLGQNLCIALKDPSKELQAYLNEINQVLKRKFGFTIQLKDLVPLSDFPLNESFKLDRKSLHSLCLQAHREFNAKSSS
jgi:acyl-coenzyme A synthetase/AMP-(fatty) acid ligase